MQNKVRQRTVEAKIDDIAPHRHKHSAGHVPGQSRTAEKEMEPRRCPARQRAWGTFIPVIYSLEGEPVVSEELIARYKTLVDSHGTGFWWSLTLAEILTGTSYAPAEHIRQGLDILDIWFDSGISWLAVLGEVFVFLYI